MHNLNLDPVKILHSFIQDVMDKSRHATKLARWVDEIEYENSGGDLREYKKEQQQWEFGYFTKRAERLKQCSKFFDFETYPQQRLKILKHIVQCKCRHCLNCQKRMQLTRLLKFGPLLDATAADYDLWHFVLTVPNCGAEFLESVIKDIKAAFKKLLLMTMCGEKKKPRAEFARYQIAAALKALEITYNIERTDYHPHLHVMLAMRKGLAFDKRHKNEFSLTLKDGKWIDTGRRFSDFEVQLQKMWWLLMNGHRVNKKTMATAGQYSVILDKVDESSYYEVFKYVTKFQDDSGKEMTKEIFKPLYNALDGRRTMQGYGLWYGITQDDEIDETYHKVQNTVRAVLQDTEQPMTFWQQVDDIEADMIDGGGFTYLNMKSIYTMDSKDLEEIVTRGKAQELSDIVDKFKRRTDKDKVNDYVGRWVQLYKQMYKRSPDFVDEDRFRETLQIDKKGVVCVARELKPRFWQGVNLLGDMITRDDLPFR